MIRAEEARKLILEHTSVLESEALHILECLDRVSAEDIYATENLPPFHNSAMDGYAVIASALKGASVDSPVTLQIVGKLPAGYTTDKKLTESDAIKIMTGAPVPEGADAVIQIEATRQEGEQVKIFRGLKKWQNIRFAGEDVKKGQLVIPKGKLLGASDIGMLAALNIGRAAVIRTPSVSLLSTGDELADIGEELLPGKIRTISNYSLYAQLVKHGAIPENLGIAIDTKEEIRRKLEEGRDCDILITAGGVSVGDYDHVRSVLTSMGMKEIFWRVAVKPGKPVLFGILGKTLVFGLPGNPVSSMVALNQFVLPAVYKMQGKSRMPWKEMEAIMEGDFEKKKNGLRYFLRARASLRDGAIYVKPLDNQSSGSFSSMIFSNCLLIIPEEVSKIQDGEKVLIQVMDEITE
ncbi:MAG TPA: gephyrin-like molybdotransferase Glp [Anaerovoracaceae bacterium]|nr:gephyrin-like molybdotransferase Glp [Anaerovoracaceae bacterium]